MATVHECASLVTKALIEKMINYQPPYIIGHASAEDIHYLSGHDSPLIYSVDPSHCVLQVSASLLQSSGVIPCQM